uniref:Reticulophagy regulator 1 n=1 Tax=Sphaeramia orbicularis TaxID=375764 RepID=A0A673AM70_9TELE
MVCKEMSVSDTEVSEQPIKSKRMAPPPHKDQPSDSALMLVNQMAGDVIAAAVTAAIQERIEAAVGGDLERPRPPESSRLLELDEDSDSEVEDFELLDQSELEQLEGELGLGVQKEGPAPGDKPSTGFLSKLLRRH